MKILTSEIVISEKRYLELIKKEEQLNSILRSVDGLVLNYAILKTGTCNVEILKPIMQKIFKDYKIIF